MPDRNPTVAPWLRQLPNALTVLRLALVLPIALLLWRRQDALALALFLIAALSDWADGAMARAWGLQSRFGAVADPIADKLSTLAAAGVLTLQGTLPGWYLLAMLLRDLVIVGGAAAWRLRFGRLEIAPSVLSKLNTTLQFGLLLGALGLRAELLGAGVWWQLLLAAAFATTLASGAHYVWTWGRAARRRAVRAPG